MKLKTRELKIKRCPFCGGEARIQAGYSYGDPPHYFVECKRCGAKGSSVCQFDSTTEECKEKCVKRWNIRLFIRR